MKHTIEQLLAVAYQHYPRGLEEQDPRYYASEEHARLVAARKKAAADERWRAMLHRILERYRIVPQSMHLPTGRWHACYSFIYPVPGKPAWETLHFLVSFLVPYQIAYRSRLVEDVEHTAALRASAVDTVAVDLHGMRFELPRSALWPEVLSELDEKEKRAEPVKQTEVDFELSADEGPVAEWISREVDATFGCERMPPEVGILVVPEVATNLRPLGEARLFDCLFRDEPPWVKPPRSSSEKGVRAQIDARRMPASFLPLAAVHGAVFAMWVDTVFKPGPVYAVAQMDGALNKQQLLKLLAEVHTAPDTPEKHELHVAGRAMEALIDAWSGEGAPSEAMVACALEFLRSREVADGGSG